MNGSAAFACAVAAFWALPAVAADWTVQPIGRVDEIRHVVVDPETGIVGIDTRRGAYRVTGSPWVRLSPGSLPRRPRPPHGAIPHARLATGDKDIAAAWYAGPTTAYGHGVLGDKIEATTLVVRTTGGEEVRFELPEDSVFEDLEPRVVDLDKDGSDEIIAVRSYFEKGSALAVFALRDGAIVPVAESEPIGLAHRWVNPVGAADFTGDGEMEIAAVVSPHLAGTLTFYRFAGDALEAIAEFPGYSTHAIGSPVQDMSAILDLDGDGVVDIALPSRDRRGLVGVSFAYAEFRELGHSDLFGRISTEIVKTELDGNDRTDLVFGLDNGNVVAVLR